MNKIVNIALMVYVNTFIILTLASMRVRQIRFTIILGLVSLVGIVAIQIYWLFTTWHMQQDRLDENIQLALKQVSNEINVLHDCLPNDLNPVQQLSETCYLVDVSCNFNQNNLEYLVRTNFNKRNVYIEHEIAIFNCETNELQFIGKFSPSGEKVSTMGNLDFCQTEQSMQLVYYFYINVSGYNGYLFKKMQLWLLLSLTVLVIVSFFAYTIFSFFRQKQLTELQRDFINNMTHEFKTPISTINIASDVLMNQLKEIPERLSNYIRIIKQENSRLNKQVENVLRAAHMEKGKTIMEMEKVDLHEILRHVFAENGLSNSQKTINTHLNLEAENYFILADRLHLTNVLFNLTDNAIKYNNDNVEIRVSTKNIKNSVELRIQDNGIGILPAHQKHIFKKFYRVPTGNLHEVKGFGLGLFYVKQVCAVHGWKIKLESEIDKGTAVVIIIPLV